MSAKAGLADHVDFKVGDALAAIAALPSGIDFVLLDLWKDMYAPCLEAFYPKLNPGAIIVADNMTRPGGPVQVAEYAAAVRAKPDLDQHPGRPWVPAWKSAAIRPAEAPLSRLQVE